MATASVWTVPRWVYVYEDPSTTTLDARAVAAHIRRTTGLTTAVRRPFFLHHAVDDPDALAANVAATRVTDAMRPREASSPAPALVHFERRLLAAPERRVPGVLYDGFQLQAVYRAVLPPGERTMRAAHVVFTSRLPGTFDEADRRYHARAVILGYPGIVSTTGLVEGPAKPSEFYAAKRGLRIESADVTYEALKQRFAGRFVDYDDPRLTQIARGYALQVVFYDITGEPFCDDPDCVLFNAHWQEAVLRAQIESGLICARHRRIAQALRRSTHRTRAKGGRKRSPRKSSRVG